MTSPSRAEVVLVRRDIGDYIEITAWVPVSPAQDFLRVAVTPGGTLLGKLGSEIPGDHVFGLPGDELGDETDPRTSAAADWFDACRRNAINEIYAQAPELARSGEAIEVGSSIHYYGAR